MKTLKQLCFLSTLTFLCLIFSSFNSNSCVNKYYSHSISIEDALKKNLISCVIKSKGGHLGDCLDMSMKNVSKEKIIVRLESGRNLESNDTNFQNIMVVREEYFVLNPLETDKKNVFGFCSQSHKSTPKIESTYSVGEMSNKTLVLLAQHLSKNKYPISSMQEAIWTLTNGRPLTSIFHPKRDSIESLQNFVSSLSEEMAPWYSIEYTEPVNGLTSDVAKNVHGVLEARLSQNTVVKIVIYDKYNIPQLRTEFIATSNGFKHPFNVNVLSLPKGRYHIGFYTLGGRIQDNVFSI